MTMNFDDVNVGGQLIVGTGVWPAIKSAWRRINGSVGVEGPVVVGDQSAFADNVGTVMVGRTINDDFECKPANRSLYTKGNVRIEGDGGTSEALNVSGGSGDNTVYIDGDLYVSGSTDTGNKGRLAERFSQADDRPKPFDMKHPSKEEGNRLRYACIEGPEVGVYYRGRVKNEKIIRLPAYWKDLVHINSISVQLQPIGAHQDVIIKRWDDEFVHLQGKGIPIDCFYHVYAERKDCNPLVVEYQGDTDKDYPDPNYNDPKYRGQNTITG